ncbi:Zeaxanthin epoxidase [Fusarium oxysporum f. sp. cubense]|uniref:Zeaxanthin epoxidase n=1 Tax=Fusarium oxysporum f. sp. cubense TaxID=61366 RepID=A0A559KTS0_FUSOC|nr:Zeaxanthin epoxidase [Fusarium oxysporum f. sp. cubense]
MATSKFLSHEENNRKIRVAIIGAGLAGLAVANGLLKDPAGRFDVQIFERDTVAFSSERGGYQLRISANGLNAIKRVSSPDVWSAIREVWSEDRETAPTLVDPVTFKALLRLDEHKWYPLSRALPRLGLRRAFLEPMLAQGRVHFSYTFKRFELTSDEGRGVRLYFDGQDPQDADILIAADGSNSQVNRQVGINNKVKLQSQFLVQSRGHISQSVRDELPESLVRDGPVLFFGGKHAFGYVSIYKNTEDLSTGQEASYQLFWSIIISRAHGEELLAKAGSDPQKMVPHLIEYVRNDLGYDEPLAHIMQSATEFIRTGPLTSSMKPDKDWRNGIDKNSRVILLGDAVHPMPPSRGMGANQALTDAGNLVDLFHQMTFKQGAPSDGELAALVRTFDEEMLTRAFNVVKSSEALTSLDSSKVSGRIFIAFVGMVMTAVGWVCSCLEIAGLKAERS